MALLKSNPHEKSIKEGSEEAKQVVCTALFRISKLWGMNDAKFAKLLHVDKSTISLWRKKGTVPDAGPQVEIIKTVLAIHRSLGGMFRATEDQIAWLTTPHPSFEEAPLAVAIKSIEGLFQVRRYVDYVRGLGA
ncbi:MAG: MbcA/ParS/Xre antitoxin family protein [Proteobacteria bacterium]|nr:MbcA/ParS/Xre antitoxin family protein [Pseudomonadota bacterium]